MSNEAKLASKIAKYTVGSIVGLIVLFGSWFVVSPGEVGVTFSRLSGKNASHSQGLHFKMPIFTGVENFDVKTQRVDVQSASASKDLQKVDVEVVLNYHLQYDKVNDLFVKVGSDYIEKVINPAVNEAVKAGTAQFPVEEIIVKREGLKKLIEDMLGERLSSYHVEMESVNLVDIKFDDEFNQVVEQKQMEEQKIKTAEYQKRQAEEKKKQTILEAEAEAEKQRLMRANLTNDIVALEWIKKWNGQLPTTVLGDKSVMMVSPKEK